jgi:hypothetical protein
VCFWAITNHFEYYPPIPCRPVLSCGTFSLAPGYGMRALIGRVIASNNPTLFAISGGNGDNLFSIVSDGYIHISVPQLRKRSCPANIQFVSLPGTMLGPVPRRSSHSLCKRLRRPSCPQRCRLKQNIFANRNERAGIEPNQAVALMKSYLIRRPRRLMRFNRVAAAASSVLICSSCSVIAANPQTMKW